MIITETRAYPTAVTVAFGRVFYGAQGRIYFGQVLVDDFSHIGRCYQKNDPIAEDASDILDTDGGEILIQDAGDIKALEPFKSGILVFCDNGIWFVSGTTDAGFSATSYMVQKISPFTLYARRTVVPVKDAILFGGKESCYVIQEAQLGMPEVLSLTEKTIDSYWQKFITNDCHAVYDELTQQVHFIKPGLAGDVLVFDAKLAAWFPWSLNVDSGVVSRSIVGGVFDDSIGKVRYAHTKIGEVQFSEQTSNALFDFGDGVYKSFIETQPETLGNYNRNKGTPLVNVLLRRTESNITGFADGAYEFDAPSSCFMSVKFDWDGNKVTQPRQVYKALPRGYTPRTIPEQLTLKNEIVTFEDKVRGKGRAVQFVFESELDKSMDLYGYSVEYSMKGRN